MTLPCIFLRRENFDLAFQRVVRGSNKEYKNFYRFSTIVVRERNLEDACVIFERINNSGKKLTIFDLLVAKAYPLNFDLRDEWKQLDRELKVFSGLNPILPMQALSLFTIKLNQDKVTSGLGDRYGCHKRHLLSLTAETIKTKWPEVKECVKLAIDFATNHVGIPTTKLIPYEAPIALYTLFFLLNNKFNPNGAQAKQLAEYFWCSCISSRYAGSPESSMEEDAQNIRAIHAGNFTGWPWARSVTSHVLLDARYDRRDATVQTILCLLASRRPLSFKSNTPIPVAREFSQFNATELHHIFPRGWLKKTGNHGWLEQEHSLANICLSPSREQRHEIGAKPPSEYLTVFKAANSELGHALESHIMAGDLVPMLDADKFSDFINRRAEALANLLNKSANVLAPTNKA